METNQNTETKKPSNPEAFGFGYGTDNYSVEQKGMTLRDYFANSAMQSLIQKLEITQQELRFGSELHYVIPVLSYQIADTMLKTREIENL